MSEIGQAMLMSRDIPVGLIQGCLVKPLREDLLPLYLQRTGNLETWLQRRAIDAHRTNSRLLKKALRLAERDDVSTALAMNAVTITDTYWVRPAGSALTWEDVRFRQNYFADLALNGDASLAFSQEPSRTPELTNIGSFEKCWQLEEGRWWLYKRADEKELFSELFVCFLGRELGFPMAQYERCGDTIRTLDFTDGATVNFESAFALVGEEEDYLENYRAFQKLGQAFADQYLQIILMDVLCFNVDRHTENYGVLRDVETGKLLCMAPNFDNNLSLLAATGGTLPAPRPHDLLARMLEDLERQTGAFQSYLERFPVPLITEDLIERCAKAAAFEGDIKSLCSFVLQGAAYLPCAPVAQLARQELTGLERLHFPMEPLVEP